MGRLTVAHTSYEARNHYTNGGQGGTYGPYSHHYSYDVYGNLTTRAGWGGWNANYTYSYTNNRNTMLAYDASGNITNDTQQLTYDATNQQTRAYYAGNWDVWQAFDGDRLRARKTDGGVTTYYLRSSVLGGQVVAEVTGGGWKGYVYLGTQLLAMQDTGVRFVHQDPVTKTQRQTDGGGGAVASSVEVDPWGGETSSYYPQLQPRKYTTYERTDSNLRDYAMMRQYHGWFSRFDQPDPSDGSYDLSDPQSFNRYVYVGNDPVNFVDPSGLCSITTNYPGYGYGPPPMTNMSSAFCANLPGAYNDMAQGEAVYGERLGNAFGGSGFRTNAEVNRALGESFSIYYELYSDGSLWTDFNIFVDVSDYNPVWALAQEMNRRPVAETVGALTLIGVAGGLVGGLVAAGSGVTLGGTAATTLGRLGPAATAGGGVLSQLGRTDQQIFRTAAQYGASATNAFGNNLGALVRAVADRIPGGQINRIGQIGNSPIYGSLRSRVGIAEVNGQTVVVRMVQGQPNVLGPLP